MPKILCIDDDRDILDSLKASLESFGHTVETAESGNEGLDKAKNNIPDLIILDVMMGSDTEGFHTSYNIRKNEELKFKPILMLTSVNQKSDFKFNPDTDGEFLPVDAFIEKPFNPKKLDELVKKLLGLPKDKINVNGKFSVMDY